MAPLIERRELATVTIKLSGAAEARKNLPIFIVTRIITNINLRPGS